MFYFILGVMTGFIIYELFLRHHDIGENHDK
ncbi:spore cortex protein [Caudoviricetes sp.]|nr:spore cortex protein [Caudoviricetes sp.]